MDDTNHQQPSRAELIYVISMVGGTITLVFAIAGWRWAGSERADLAQWLMAGAAIATLIAAIGAGVFAAGAFSVEMGREDRHADAEERSQAERVAAWTVVGMHASATAGEVTLFPELYLRNASDLPVYNVMVNVRLHYMRAGEKRQTDLEILFPTLPPSGPELEPRFLDEVKFSLPRPRAGGGFTTEGSSFTLARTTVQFTDSGGRIWHRLPTGGLKGPMVIDVT